MAQTDSFALGNVPGATFRGNLNEILAALQSTNAGSTAPTATAPGMLWFDSTAPGIWKYRNTANDDWFLLFADDAVTNAKLANMETAKLKGRVTAGLGDPEDLTVGQVQTLLGVEGLTQAQAENTASTVFGTVSGQRLGQALAAGAAWGAIGSFGFLYRTSRADVNPGASVAGSGLRWSSAIAKFEGGNRWEDYTQFTASINGALVSGTWQCLGHIDVSASGPGSPISHPATLFRRIS